MQNKYQSFIQFTGSTKLIIKTFNGKTYLGLVKNNLQKALPNNKIAKKKIGKKSKRYKLGIDQLFHLRYMKRISYITIVYIV